LKLTSLIISDDEIAFNYPSNRYGQEGKVELTKFVETFLSKYVSKEQNILHSAPSTISHVGVRLDISLVRDPQTRSLVYYVNEVARYPGACLFLKEDTWAERAYNLAFMLQNSLLKHLEKFQKAFRKP
jgi:hypothetical protein